MCEKVQNLIIDYGEKYTMEQYAYVYYDFGNDLAEDQMIQMKAFLKDKLHGKDCIGSINAYCGRVNGFLLMDYNIFEGLERQAREYFTTVEKFENVKNQTNVTYYVNDKWGRAESFLLFD